MDLLTRLTYSLRFSRRLVCDACVHLMLVSDYYSTVTDPIPLLITNKI